jgi:RNA polymerase sigma-70 factor (ECF subfamily)
MDDVSINLMMRWQAGDQQAASELFARYADRLIALARGRLSAQLARRVDPEDVVQSAYRSFFAGAREGQYDLQRGGDMWRLLVAITLHKLQDQVKHHTAGKRSIRAEQNFGSEDSLLGIQPHLLAQAPDPVAAVALVDEVEQLMRRLEPLQRRMLELRLQGHNLYEIAEQTQRSLSTVCRVLDRVKEQIEQAHARRGDS